MKAYPISELQSCSVRNCKGRTEVIIQRQIGDEKLLFGYCSFHWVVSATFFEETRNRRIVGRMEVA